jgi:hypothetical protein
MEGLWAIVSFVAFVYIANRVIRLYVTMKFPKLGEAWDELEAKKEAKRKRLAGGAFTAGLDIAKFLMKK